MIKVVDLLLSKNDGLKRSTLSLSLSSLFVCLSLLFDQRDL